MQEVPPRGGVGGGVGQGDGGGLGHGVEHSGEEGSRRVRENHTGRGSHMELEGLHKVEGLECIRTGGQDSGHKLGLGCIHKQAPKNYMVHMKFQRKI